MSEDRLARALRSVGDDFIREHPADFEALRNEVARRRRKRFLSGFGTVAVTATAVIAFLVVGPFGSDRETLPPAGGAEGLGITLEVTLDGIGQEIAGGGERAFVTIPANNEVVRLDVGDDEPIWRATLSGEPRDIMQTESFVWVSIPEADAVAKIDVDDGVVQEIPLEGYTEPTRIHVGAGALRAVVNGGVIKMDLATLEITPIYNESAVDIAMGPTAFWVLGTDGVIRGIDPNTGAPADVPEIPAAAVGAEITYLRGALWYGESGRTELVRIEESDGSVAPPIRFAGGYIDIDAGDEGLWVLVDRDVGGSIHELSAVDGSPIGTPFSLDGTPRDLSVNEGGLWVTLDDGRVLNIDD